MAQIKGIIIVRFWCYLQCNYLLHVKYNNYISELTD